jgi:hypothetical protein
MQSSPVWRCPDARFVQGIMGIEAFAVRMGRLYGGIDFSAWRRCNETLALCRAVSARQTKIGFVL